MIKCVHKINMATFPNFGRNTHYVIKWELMDLGYSPERCNLEYYDEGSIRTFMWDKPSDIPVIDLISNITKDKQW